MTFDNAAWAINGANVGASFPRIAQFAASSGAQGLINKGDLLVSELDVPGVGVKIGPGPALVRNRYQTTPNETYVVNNPSEYIIPSGDMPSVSGSDKSYILAIVVGDPDFTQTGHPWMLGTDPPLGEESTFRYVRPTFIEVAGDTVTSLDVGYPALELARIDIPASTSTITDAMITNLAGLANPRQSQASFVSPGGTWTSGSPRYIPSGVAYANWGPADYQPSILVPEWATRAILMVSINGVRYKDTSVNIAGNVRAKIGSVAGSASAFDFEVEAASARRANLMCAGQYDVSSIAGTFANLTVEGYQNAPGSPTNDQKLRLQNGSQMIFDIRFFEE